MAKIVTAAVVIIGNEILSGRTKDANLAWLAGRLNESGVVLREARVIPDVDETIVATVNELRARFDYVFTTGGIGPTHDDITAASIARAFGVKLIRDQRAVALLRAHYASPADLNEARMRMADMPEGSELIDNPVSRAPGFRTGNVFVMAGVPRIMQAMFDGLRHTLTGGAPMLSHTLTVTLTEGRMAAGLAEIQGRYSDLEIGSYPFFRLGQYGTSIVTRGFERARVDAAVGELRAMMRAMGGEPQDGDGPAETPARAAS
jgi:molybdenum cofactor synthesis domain-containing protein